MLNKKSGVLGVSGVASDFRDVESAAGIDSATGNRLAGNPVNERAQLALDIFCYETAKYIGAYCAVIGGLNALVFTAGVGENSPYVRRRVCEKLSGIGVLIDEKANEFRGQPSTEVTGHGSAVRIFVIPTNEELVIARDTAGIIAPVLS